MAILESKMWIRSLASCLLLFSIPACSIGSENPIAVFHERALPTNQLGDWNWIQGDGRLSIDDRKRLVLSAANPSQGSDNRIGAAIDLGHREADSFVLDVSIDPASNIAGEGCNQLDCGITVGLPDKHADPNRFKLKPNGLSLNIRDLNDVADYGVFWNGRDISLPVPADRGTGNPRAFNRHDGSYKFRMVVTPSKSGSRIRIYRSQFVTPDWEGTIPTRIKAGYVGVYARLVRHRMETIETTIQSLSLRPLDPEIANWQPTDAESVLYALNLDYPGLEKVKESMKKGDVANATSNFAAYLRNRNNVTGPTVSKAKLSDKEQRIVDLMVQDKLLVYTGGTPFEHQFQDPYDWAVDPYKTGGQFAIYNSRMFPWIDMGRAYQATGDTKYARTFVKQLNSWLDQIPLRIILKPGGKPFFIDGNTLEPPLLFTGNMGRRIELTWWQAYELFKNAPEFDDASLMRMMKYFQDNARLVTNPSIFLAWDDSGLHMATGLLQCATMMPEWRESEKWKAIAFDRLEKTFRAQVHPDGTHASLSTGYGWATIDSYRNVFEIMQRNDEKIPPKFTRSIREMIMSYMGILRPDFGSISLNDGGWGPVDDKIREYQSLFTDDQEISFFASKGAKGKSPAWTSRYFPNAGWYAMRTGFGSSDKMLFMDGGPFGASHGKQDALHLVVACGSSLLLRDGGRGDYTQKPTSVWASNTHAFNTLTPDWGLQDRTHRYDHEKHVGFHPPKRPWITNAQFDYGRSTYDAGWFLDGKRIGGTHTRHVIFLKGKNPPETGYWIVVDQVKPADDVRRTWRHPWHLSTEDFAIDKTNNSLTTKGAGANLRILPIDPDNNLELETIKGQTKPAIQGWRVWGSSAKPFTVPTYHWPASGPFTKVWLLLPQNSKQKNFELSNSSPIDSNNNRLSFTLQRMDGGRDHVFIAKKPNAGALGQVLGRKLYGNVAVVRVDSTDKLEAVLETK